MDERGKGEKSIVIRKEVEGDGGDDDESERRGRLKKSREKLKEGGLREGKKRDKKRDF